MDAAPLAFLACLAVSAGGRAHFLLLALERSAGRSAALLLVAGASSLAATSGMACLGAELSGHIIGQQRAWLVALALLLGAVELAIPVGQLRLEEPTRSHGAIALVLFWRQLFDAPRLCIFASAAALADPVPALAGGWLASLATIAIAWRWPEILSPVGNLARFMRIAMAATLLAAALLIVSIDS